MKHILFIETNTTGTGAKAMYIAKEKGYKIHFWTSDPKQYSSIKIDNPLNIADEILTIDTYNVEKMIEELNNTTYKFDGVLAFDDYHLIPAAKVAEHLGQRTYDTEALNLVRYKNLTRQHFKENITKLNFKQPGYAIINPSTNLNSKDISFPCVLKPVDDSGSNGVSICSNKEDLELALNHEMGREKNERGYILEKKWLVEEYIEGQEYSAEMLFTSEGWKLISVTKKDIYGKHAVECGHVTSNELSPVENLEEYCINLLTIFKLNYGAAHIEFISKDDGLYLVEINPRLAGDCIPDLVKIATGVDMIENIVFQAIGENSIVQLTESKAASVQFCMPEQLGTYHEILNIEKAEEVPGVKKVHTVNLPFVVEKVSSSYHRLGYVISEGMSPTEAYVSAKGAVSLLRCKINKMKEVSFVK
ncbi:MULTISPECIES: ATP-grasp domain-containing protein [Bacillus cereus group]|uniref:ATP-grasp domain-containing protein n=1 Tax=Bacillus cereus group TaxID=86661 RepID=UPI0001A1C7C7|nr:MULTISPECIES: ATP-grasp domain-containing protein [Bacillus cereus group]EEM69075.1 hypothetical protein bthur0009_48460 [Bacillus thuringiensis serovar andalousiensis BGSC 4AW1]MEB9627227.1 ATP-grasp domain-containing protein [Bacillus anthracis]OUA98251.1 phosphoribosylglycinamide formyltransferase [Bacillus thuringiensis serovar oswaldocruzi]